jgi:glyoxylase-like metal-dependent hydrolase (beta-lactamase superfamily II)
LFGESHCATDLCFAFDTLARIFFHRFMAIPLEDNFADIIGKAQRGLCLADSELASRAGVTVSELKSARAGSPVAGLVEKIAPVLGLGAAALAESARGTWHPTEVELEGLAAFATNWDGMLVNAYIVCDSESKEAAAFDTGSDCGPMLDFLEHNNLKLRCILLTHTHGDHVFDLDRLKSKTKAPAFVSKREPLDGAEAFDEGREFRVGALRIETRLTWGHSRGGTTYVVRGLARPVAVVGDAMFAGSMGGGMVSYHDALRTNRQQILSLPDDAILCPGHGPMTTVGEENRHNPFFAV